MSNLLIFAAGFVLAALIIPLVNYVRQQLKNRGVNATLEDNKVTTASQILHLATQSAPTAVAVLDKGGSVLLSNSRAHDMSIVHDRTVNPEILATSEKVREDQESRVVEMVLPKRRTGNRVTNVRALVKPLTLVDDRFIVVYGTDESEGARMENARRDFVANVSHELKTPVGAMSLLAEALLDSPEDVEHVEYFGTKILDESHRMGHMISELISLSKLQGAEALPEMAVVKIDEVIEEAVSRNQTNAEGAGIQINVGEGFGVEVQGDRSLLVTAISNLISNAINYSTVSMPVSISQKIVGDVIHVRVTDRGIGIAPEDQKRVFERFFRVDRARSRSTGGTGLGLAIVKHVVANHGGNITVWSRLGTGSTFTIELPIYHSQELIEQPEEESTEEGDTALRRAVSRVTTRRKDKTS